MSLLRECPFCGAALDPGERCDCQNEAGGPGRYDWKGIRISPCGRNDKENAGSGAGTPEPAKAEK